MEFGTSLFKVGLKYIIKGSKVRSCNHYRLPVPIMLNLTYVCKPEELSCATLLETVKWRDDWLIRVFVMYTDMHNLTLRCVYITM